MNDSKASRLHISPVYPTAPDPFDEEIAQQRRDREAGIFSNNPTVWFDDPCHPLAATHEVCTPCLGFGYVDRRNPKSDICPECNGRQIVPKQKRNG